MAKYYKHPDWLKLNSTLQISWICTILLCCSWLSYSQDSTIVFNRSYDVGFQHRNQAFSVLEFDTHYLVNEVDHYWPLRQRSFVYRVIDKNGVSEKIKSYPLDSFAYNVMNGVGMFKTHDGNVLDTRVLYHKDTNKQGFALSSILLIKSTPFGDTLWTRQIWDSIAKNLYSRSTIQLEDSSFVCSAYEFTEDNVTPIFFKLNRQGKRTKIKRFSTHKDDAIYHCLYHPNGKLYATGLSNSHTNGNYYTQLMMCLDTGLNLQWIKRIGPESFTQAHPTVLSNGDILIPSSEVKGEIGTNSLEQKMLMKVDTNGNVLWRKSYGGIAQVNYFFRVLELEDRSWVVLGYNRRKEFEWGSWPSLMKLSATGDSLWQVDYVHDHPSDRLASLIQTKDGGFIMAGSAITDDQDSWLNKVDSNGIGIFVADTTRRIPNTQEHINPTSSYVIYPNPAKNEITLRFADSLEGKPEKLEWVSLSGQVLSRQAISESGTKYPVPDSPGIYLVLIKDESRHILHRERVVVE